MDEKESLPKVTGQIQKPSDTVVVYSPEQELKVLVQLAEGKQIDWKPAILMATAYLEKFGIAKLKRHFKDRKRKFSGKLESLSLNQVAILLYGLEIISEDPFDFMTQMWRERISITHQKGELPAYVGNEANKKYGEMIRRVLEILKLLKS